MLLTSFHGLPKRYLDAGDPYHCECAQTSRLLAEEIGWTGDRVRLAFQSRFGREEWLKPYIQEVITELPSQGIKKIAIISPGFISDCVETLEEVAIGLKESFLEAGGEKFTYVPCLNSSKTALTFCRNCSTGVAWLDSRIKYFCTSIFLVTLLKANGDDYNSTVLLGKGGSTMEAIDLLNHGGQSLSKILQVLDLIKKICNKFLKWACVSQITVKLDRGEFK